MNTKTYIIIFCVFLQTCTLINASNYNLCGGQRPLNGSPGDPCMPTGPCKHGILVCYGQESFRCAPKCKNSEGAVNIEESDEIKVVPVIQKKEEIKKPVIDDFYKFENQKSYNPVAITESPKIQVVSQKDNGFVCPPPPPKFCTRMNQCGPYGVCSDLKEKCVCFPGYSGEFCNVRDLCHDVECGNHGSCLSGRCICDPDFMGTNCQTWIGCEPGGFWNEGQCFCRDGYEGIHCDSCSSDGLCVPTLDKQNPFILVFVSTTMKKKMLNDKSPQPPQYLWRPVMPGTNGLTCDCQVTHSEGKYKQSSMVENLVDKEVPYYTIPDYTSSYYVDDYIIYHEKKSCYEADQHTAGAIFLTFVFFLLFIMVILVYFSREDDTHKHIDTHHDMHYKKTDNPVLLDRRHSGVIYE